MTEYFCNVSSFSADIGKTGPFCVGLGGRGGMEMIFCVGDFLVYEVSYPLLHRIWSIIVLSICLL